MKLERSYPKLTPYKSETKGPDIITMKPADIRPLMIRLVILVFVLLIVAESVKSSDMFPQASPIIEIAVALLGGLFWVLWVRRYLKKQSHPTAANKCSPSGGSSPRTPTTVYEVDDLPRHVGPSGTI
ncbi:MAG: hypothetical protein JRN21_02500 [Nitrososphaerota archaeon]|nr:hypothetical protein [Nitrososphaerota archaeon]